MVNQRTLKNSFTLEGKGLHTGLDIVIKFNPAPENHGYKIRRVDVSGQPIIDALAENVTGTQRGTVLSANGVYVSTVEHALAALYACEIDNCLIDVNGPEFPILDGSSILYVSKIKEVGAQQQDAVREYITIKRKKVKVIDKTTGSSMVLIPDESFSIESHISFNSTFLRRQDATLNNLSEFTRDFASARTFVFVKEIEPLLNNNLVKGGDLDNAIVIYDKPIEQEKFDQLADMMHVKRKDSSKLGYIMNKPLLYPNEPARHKLLDIIGDLALVGKFIKGKVVANCPGHKINNMFARAIREAVNPKIKVEAPVLLADSGSNGYYGWNPQMI
ncbi:MAG: UDP-3-O-acyl-N-acetylglucosamine deacetylase [Dysgonomonas sp.]|jgi:UDP-3-O-[3-hydroxymyristoyl] N-acetylglucosamine deacetylase/3-hydroxyacyl-[acyl-carrier-protein] dehydratase|nr:UDP-3-O-acyl-N-acetylglucosamine deacetylase [Prevotella sp.]